LFALRACAIIFQSSQEKGDFPVAVKTSAKARKNQRKKLFTRVITIVVVSIMAGGILLATLISRLY